MNERYLSFLAAALLTVLCLCFTALLIAVTLDAFGVVDVETGPRTRVEVRYDDEAA